MYLILAHYVVTAGLEHWVLCLLCPDVVIEGHCAISPKEHFNLIHSFFFIISG